MPLRLRVWMRRIFVAGGACGQCQARVLACEGVLVHADHYLSEAEKASGAAVMPCVSRFDGKRLVLDL